MDRDQQNIAIAEALGWTRIAREFRNWDGPPTEEIWGSPDLPDGENTDGRIRQEIPDFTGSLDAMHDAENTIIRPARLWYKYCLNLPGRSFDESIGSAAADRAESFLKTLGLWI